MRVLGAAVAAGSLWLPWYYNDDPPSTTTGWETFVHADQAVFWVAVVVGVLALVPPVARSAVASAFVAGGCWVMVGVCLDRVWAVTDSVPYPAWPRVGVYVAVGGFAVAALGWTLRAAGWRAWPRPMPIPRS